MTLFLGQDVNISRFQTVQNVGLNCFELYFTRKVLVSFHETFCEICCFLREDFSILSSRGYFSKEYVAIGPFS